MISNGIHGGIATVPNWFALANNKYMGDANDSRWKPTKFTTLSKYKQPLWLGNESAITNIRFQWMSNEEINNLEEYSLYHRSRPRIS